MRLCAEKEIFKCTPRGRALQKFSTQTEDVANQIFGYGPYIS
jgi:hypothetical protein